MKRRMIGVGAVLLVLALLLTLAPACGKEEREVKTLKVGFMAALSGPAAPWGTVFLRGAEWARDVINERGGLEVGGDRYMIEVISCDTKFTGSVGADCATKLVYDEGIHYVVGPHSTAVIEACLPIFEPNKTFSTAIGFVRPVPEVRYAIGACVYPPSWVGAFLDFFHQFHPDVTTIATIGPEWDADDPTGFHVSTKNLASEHGMELVGSRTFTPGTTDFYPQLSPLVALNPGVIATPACAPGENGLITKQLRELGYEGVILHVTGGPIPDLIEIAGVEAMEGVATNEIDYTSPVMPEATRQIYQDFVRRYPGQDLVLVMEMGYVNMMFYAQAIEEADSIDPEEVMKVIDDPDWTFDRFGVTARIGGMETFGMRRQLPIQFTYSEVENGQLVTKATILVESP